MIKYSAGELPAYEVQLFVNCCAIKVLPGHSRSWGECAMACACCIQSEPMWPLSSPADWAARTGYCPKRDTHQMGENSLIKEGMGGAELWECSTGYVSHLPHCNCLSMEKILLTQIFCSTSDRHCCETLLFPSKKISFHPKCNAGAGIHPAPSPASPTAPGSTENTAIFIPHFHKSSEWCCTDRGSSLECKCGQRKVWTGEKLLLLPSTLYLTEEENRKKDASCFDSCSQFNVSSKVNILSWRNKIIIGPVKICLSKHQKTQNTVPHSQERKAKIENAAWGLQYIKTWQEKRHPTQPGKSHWKKSQQQLLRWCLSLWERTREKPGEQADSYFARKTSALIVFHSLHGTVGNPQLGQAGKGPPAFIQPCPLALAAKSLTMGTVGIYCWAGPALHHCSNTQPQNAHSLLAPMGSRGFHWKMLIPFNKMTFMVCTLLVLMSPPARVDWFTCLVLLDSNLL